MGLKVTSKLRSLLTLDIINLSKFTIPEKGERLAAIDTLDVHTQGHYDLIVSIRRGLILETNFDSFVRNLHHLEVILHLFLEDRVI